MENAEGADRLVARIRSVPLINALPWIGQVFSSWIRYSGLKVGVPGLERYWSPISPNRVLAGRSVHGTRQTKAELPWS
jgi:hypothetical protein